MLNETNLRNMNKKSPELLRGVSLKRKDKRDEPGVAQIEHNADRFINAAVGTSGTETSVALLRELVAHLRQNRTQLREEWARRITEAELLTAMSKEEIFTEAT